MLYLCTAFERKRYNAEIAQLVEHNLAKVGVASSSLVFRSTKSTMNNDSFEGKLKSCHFLYKQK